MSKKSNFVNLAVIVKLPKDKLDAFFEMLSNLEDTLIVFKRVSWMDLWITEHKPGEEEQ